MRSLSPLITRHAVAPVNTLTEQFQHSMSVRIRHINAQTVCDSRRNIDNTGLLNHRAGADIRPECKQRRLRALIRMVAVCAVRKLVVAYIDIPDNRAGPIIAKRVNPIGFQNKTETAGQVFLRIDFFAGIPRSMP